MKKLFSFFRISLISVIGAAAFLTGCNESAWSSREAKTVEDIHVDSLKFRPAGTRFILQDSATEILFRSFRIGFACSRWLEFGLDSVELAEPSTFRPLTTLQLPENAVCAQDTARHDSLITRIFRARPESKVRLLNSSDALTDSATLIHGKMHFDSLMGVKDILGTVSQGRFTFRDSSDITVRALFADSFSTCDSLNYADYKANGDTVKVRYSWVTLDSTASVDTCKGPARLDSLVLGPSLP